jgi:hypothetical protein
MNSRSLLRPVLPLLLLAFFAATLPARAADGPPRSFSLSSSRTFAPGESVKIQLYAHNVPALEFRVYKVNDAQKFFSRLKELHSFGEQDYSPSEQIDKPTLLEQIHDLKADLWYRVRHFFRSQFTDEARDSFREQQGKLGKRSKVLGISEFAQIPLLNGSQLVARWKLVTPPAIVSETQQLPIDGLKSGVYLIEATDGTYKAYTVAIVTEIAMVERSMDGHAQILLADRKTGAPVSDATVVLFNGHKQDAQARTDQYGMASLTSSAVQGVDSDAQWLLARHGSDVAIVTPSGYEFGSSASEHDTLAYVYTDRPVYRPGHTVHIKAILRQRKNDQLLLPSDLSPTLEVKDADDKTVLSRSLALSPHGTLTADFDLAPDAALGYYSVRIGGQSVEGSGNFYVEEYKKPEYQVTVKPAVQRVLQGNNITATIEARYFFGEPVAGAKVKYQVSTTTHYWWGEDDDSDSAEGGESGESSDSADYAYSDTEQQEQEGTLDANGRLVVNLPTRVDGKGQDQDYRIEARVTDAANREVSGHSTVLATYGSFRLNAEPTSYVTSPGQPVRVKLTALDYDNHPIRTAVHVEIAQHTWDSVTHQSNDKQMGKLDAITGADGTVLVDLPLSGANGDFAITASAKTPENRTVQSHTWVWVWNGAGQWYNENTQAQIVADKKSYQVGDTAHLLLVTGLKECWAMVTVEGNSVQQKFLLHATSESFPFDVPITSTSEPNLLINAILVHNDQLMTAQKSLKVPLVERTLSITATPNKQKYLPGEKGIFDVLALDWQGHPVQADLSFGEVDEALYKVRPDESGDIVSSFYPKRYSYVEPQTSFNFYFSGSAGLKSPLLASAATYHPRLAQVKPGSDLVVPKVRKAFPDTAYWNPNVHTGPDGHARVEFTFPDALTTWRTTIRGMTDDGKAGGAVTRVLVRKNLIVRLATPRFFRQGDETVLRVIAHNYLETAKETTFNLGVQGLDVIGGSSQKIVIPAKGESYVDWRVKARSIGGAVLTASALTNEASDALEMTLPILPYGVKQRAATSSVLFSGPAQAQWGANYPANTDPNARTLSVTVSSSVAGTVFSALDYLTGYPWGCTEQTMSSFLPDVIVAQAIDRLHIKPPIDRVELNKMVAAGVERLNGFQHDDGGWGWWPDDPSRVFMTAYVVAGLGQAHEAGYPVQEFRLQRGRRWLVNTLAAHPNMLADLHAYVVYALATTGDVDKKDLDKAWDDRNQISDEGLALVGLAMDAAHDGRAHEIAKLLERKAHTEGNFAYWTGNYDGMMEYWDDTSAETTALALKLLVRQDRTSGLMPKAALWLGQHRSGDYWFSTKQTAMVIAGLTDYLSLSGEMANTSDVEVLLNGTTLGKHHFGPADVFAQPWKLRVPAAQAHSGGQLTVRKTGNGISYWSAEINWYSADKKNFQQGKVGLNLTRDYYLLQKKQATPNDPITYDLVPLHGPVHVGDTIAVKLAVGGTEQKYLLSEDPIPAGTEFITDAGLYHINNKPSWWYNWFTRREFHDDRAAFFNSDFNGRREYFYLLKVTTPGKFAVSPAQTAPMYQPDIQATTDPIALEVQQ